MNLQRRKQEAGGATEDSEITERNTRQIDRCARDYSWQLEAKSKIGEYDHYSFRTR